MGWQGDYRQRLGSVHNWTASYLVSALVWRWLDMVDQERVQIFLVWCLGTSAAAGAVEAVTAAYFVRAGIEVSLAENIGFNMGFVLHLEEKRRRSLVRSWYVRLLRLATQKGFRLTWERKPMRVEWRSPSWVVIPVGSCWGGHYLLLYLLFFLEGTDEISRPGEFYWWGDKDP